MTATRSHDIQRIRADFDQIATFGDESGADRYNPFLVSLVPSSAADGLEVGCGLGRLAAAIAGERRNVVGLDLSSVMIERARQETPSPRGSIASSARPHCITCRWRRPFTACRSCCGRAGA